MTAKRTTMTDAMNAMRSAGLVVIGYPPDTIENVSHLNGFAMVDGEPGPKVVSFWRIPQVWRACVSGKEQPQEFESLHAALDHAASASSTAAFRYRALSEVFFAAAHKVAAP